MAVELIDPRTGVREVPTWFGDPERPLSGWLAVPPDGRARGAVVLCQPLAEEQAMAHRTFRTLAQELARQGLLALRFDYDGTGDSAGRLGSPDRVAAWTASVRAAVEHVRGCGPSAVAVVGMRLGATIAARAAACEDLALERLVLWDPCVSARLFLRELKLLHAPLLDGREAAPDGWVETPGFAFPPPVVEDLAVLDLGQLDQNGKLARDVTVLVRDDRPEPRGLRAALAHQDVAWAAAHDQQTLLNVPTLDAAVPDRTLAHVVGLADPDPDRVETVVPVGLGRVRTVARFRAGAADVVEEPHVFDGVVFGISTRAARPVPAGTPWVVLVNVGRESHIGPGRAWVVIARTLAAQGYRCLRVDRSGVGDGGLRDGQVADERFAAVWPHDLLRVVAALRAHGAPVVLLGHSASGHDAFEAALTGGVDGVVAVNPHLEGTVDGSDAVAPSRPSPAFRRPPAGLRRLARRHRRLAGTLWRATTGIVPTWSTPWVVWATLRRGTRVALVAPPEELVTLRRGAAWRVAARRWRRRGRLVVEEVPDVDHSLLVLSGQREVERAVARSVGRLFPLG